LQRGDDEAGVLDAATRGLASGPKGIFSQRVRVRVNGDVEAGGVLASVLVRPAPVAGAEVDYNVPSSKAIPSAGRGLDDSGAFD
jgi:hypothetical protein